MNDAGIRKAALMLSVIIAIMIASVILKIPSGNNLDNRGAARYYLNEGLEETGSANIVNSIVWDFRGYDTLGEETVLFIAATGVYFLSLALRKSIDQSGKEEDDGKKKRPEM